MPSILLVALSLVGFLVLRLLYRRFVTGLNGIPGPTLAKYSRLWKLHSVWKGDHHLTEIELHKKHGPLVRIGPRHVSIADPGAVGVIYGLNKGFAKTGFYPIQCITWCKRPQMNLFSTRDEQWHREQKRHVASAYSMTSLLELEPAVDSCTELLVSRLRQLAGQEKVVDLGTWLHYYAFDVVGELTFAKKLGFLAEGRDVDDLMSGNLGFLAYASVIGQVPEMHNVLLGNPLLPILIPSMESWNPVLQFTLEQLNLWTPSARDGEMEKADLGKGRDMQSRWMAIHYADPDKMSGRDVIVHLSSNVFAGADTTAIALRAIIYFLLKNEKVLGKVLAELDDADRDERLSSPIAYRESMTHLPYLGAVIKEAMRLHPSVGLMLERHVPQEGVTVCGRHIPAGTTVGINAWVLQHDPKVFPDPESFVPERWLKSTPEKLKEMEQSFFAFGAGSRTCMGKNISLIEMHKIIPQLLRDFTIRLHSPKEEWKTKNAWFVQQEGLICDLERRK
ncbi:cytochrome P450 [Aspergillus karnatakaensis]|uniref:cytochrome P450 n=1 Tax=Aspergillus karnatakaensis TaxID=1810916 RepID=UPI003CCDDDDE